MNIVLSDILTFLSGDKEKKGKNLNRAVSFYYLLPIRIFRPDFHTVGHGQCL